jgi:hypothetical protein
MRIRYANDRKLRAQMAKRGWTEEQIIEALQTTGIAARGKKGRRPDISILGPSARSWSTMPRAR